LKLGKKLTATSYDSYQELVEKYPESEEILKTLKEIDTEIQHGVDATNLQSTLKGSTDNKYDRIIFQFPLVHPNETREDYVSQGSDLFRNRRLVRNFIKSSAPLLTEKGQIHITSKDVNPYNLWRIPKLATGLYPTVYIEEIPFLAADYPGYTSRNVVRTKSFPLTAGKTYIFTVNNVKETEEEYIARKSTETSKKRKRSDSYAFYCPVCDIRTTCLKDLEKHQITKSHKKNVQIETAWSKE